MIGKKTTGCFNLKINYLISKIDRMFIKSQSCSFILMQYYTNMKTEINP